MQLKSAINILMPVKNLKFCKQRLASSISLQHRQKLVMLLLRKKLHTLRNHFSQHNVLVITPDPAVIKLARQFNADVLIEASAQGLNAAINSGTRWSLEQGYRSQIVLAPDIAWLDVNELNRFIDRAGESTVVAICAANDWGTNVLLTRPPNIIEFQYGPYSAKRMFGDSKKLGIKSYIFHLPHLSRDIDTYNDLVVLQEYLNMNIRWQGLRE